MQICVNKDTIGTDKHLIYDGATYGWSRTVPAGAWTHGFTGDTDLQFQPIDSRSISETL